MASIFDNNRNCRKSKSGVTSLYKGVFRRKSEKKWCAAICSGGKKTLLGYFATEEGAARAYDAAALEFHGAFARLNFPESQAA